VSALVFYAAYVATATQRAELGSDAVAALGWVTNWHEIATGTGYLAANSVPSPLVHTWSLGIEVQWYVVWPLCVVGLCLLLRRRRHGLAIGAAACFAAALGSAVLMAWLASRDGVTRAYYGTDTRAAALFLGSALAFAVLKLERAQPRAWRTLTGALTATVVALIAGTALVAAMVTVDHQSPWLYRGGFLALGLATVAVLFACTHPVDNPVRWFFSLALLEWLGLISYSLYLWHWPVFLTLTADRTGLDGAPLLIARVGASIALAWLTWRLVENPIRRRQIRPRVWIPVGAAAGAVALIGFVIVEQSRPTYRLPELQALNDSPSTPVDDGAPVVYFAGDSIALTLGKGVAVWSDESRAVQVGGDPQLGCGLVQAGESERAGEPVDPPAYCDRIEQRWQRNVAKQAADVAVLVPSVWDLQDRSFDGSTWLSVGDPAFDAAYLDGLDAAVAALSSNGAPVGIVTLPVFYNESAHVQEPDAPIREEDPTIIRAFNRLLRDYAAANPATFVIDLASELDGTEQHPTEYRDTPLFGDGVHFTTAGAEALAPWLVDQIEVGARARSAP
jgi:peptidoglycan/LPS O-acetylase OafA/YrhL/lysophospholipase L1-like esterase